VFPETIFSDNETGFETSPSVAEDFHGTRAACRARHAVITEVETIRGCAIDWIVTRQHRREAKEDTNINGRGPTFMAASIVGLSSILASANHLNSRQPSEAEF